MTFCNDVISYNFSSNYKNVPAISLTEYSQWLLPQSFKGKVHQNHINIFFFLLQIVLAFFVEFYLVSVTNLIFVSEYISDSLSYFFPFSPFNFTSYCIFSISSPFQMYILLSSSGLKWSRHFQQPHVPLNLNFWPPTPGSYYWNPKSSVCKGRRSNQRMLVCHNEFRTLTFYV